MKKRTLAIGSALILGAGIYIGSQSVFISSTERDNLIMLSKGLIRRINNKDYEACREYFDDALKESISIEKMEDIFGSTLDILGQFNRFSAAQVIKKKRENSLHTSCTVKCDYKNGPATYVIVFDADKKVSGIHLE